MYIRTSTKKSNNIKKLHITRSKSNKRNPSERNLIMFGWVWYKNLSLIIERDHKKVFLLPSWKFSRSKWFPKKQKLYSLWINFLYVNYTVIKTHMKKLHTYTTTILRVKFSSFPMKFFLVKFFPSSSMLYSPSPFARKKETHDRSIDSMRKHHIEQWLIFNMIFHKKNCLLFYALSLI